MGKEFQSQHEIQMPQKKKIEIFMHNHEETTNFSKA
jgi:hypothetical protein